MDQLPYQSIYYKTDGVFERFGTVIVPAGAEVFLYITERAAPKAEEFRYLISNHMHIYDTKRGMFMKVRYTGTYPNLDFYVPEKRDGVTYLLHRLYMLTFCYFPGCEAYDVNHIDGNKMNTVPRNLEWLSHKDNANHAFSYIKESKISDTQIIEMLQLYNNGWAVRDIARMYGISYGYLSGIICPRKSRGDTARVKRIKQICPITRAPRMAFDEPDPWELKRYNLELLENPLQFDSSNGFIKYLSDLYRNGMIPVSLMPDLPCFDKGSTTIEMVAG